MEGCLFIPQGDHNPNPRTKIFHTIHRLNQDHISYLQLGLQLELIDPGIVREWVNLYRKKRDTAIQTSHGRKSYLKH